MVDESLGQQRTLVVAALAWNAVLSAYWIVGGGGHGATVAAVVAGPPFVLLALLRHPRALSVGAAVLGLVYALLIVITFSAFALLFAVPALCLLSAALLPWLSWQPEARRQRRLVLLGTIVAAVLILAGALVALAL